MIQRILLATDGLASAERAADFAASLGSRYGAKVTVLHVCSPAPSWEVVVGELDRENTVLLFFVPVSQVYGLRTREGG
jgi:nucleotide-binding universal stress UspA family protein